MSERSSTIILDGIEAIDLQDQIEARWNDGIKTIVLCGRLVVEKELDHLLRIDKNLSGIAIAGSGILDGGGITSHLIVVENSEATLAGLTLLRGDTTDASRVARNYNSNSKHPNIFEVIDGAGLLVLGTSKVGLEDCKLEDNHSGMCGGGISVQGGEVIIRNSLFRSNTAYHTGAAVDGLTPGSRVNVSGTRFENNNSNEGSMYGGPHGQVTVFGHTIATVKECEFEGASYPYDVSPDAIFNECGNIYDGLPVAARASGGKRNVILGISHLITLLGFQIRLARNKILPTFRVSNGGDSK